MLVVDRHSGGLPKSDCQCNLSLITASRVNGDGMPPLPIVIPQLTDQVRQSLFLKNQRFFILQSEDLFGLALLESNGAIGVLEVTGQYCTDGFAFTGIRGEQNQSMAIGRQKIFSDHGFDGIDFRTQKPHFRREPNQQIGQFSMHFGFIGPFDFIQQPLQPIRIG